MEPEADCDDLLEAVPEGATAEPEGATAEPADPSDAEQTSTAIRKYPLRNRQPPQTLTYDTLGQTSTTSRLQWSPDCSPVRLGVQGQGCKGSRTGSDKGLVLEIDLKFMCNVFAFVLIRVPDTPNK